MIPGFNHNIKHKGRIYHIQTEDSGPKNPHIITHLFVGGNILASKKTEYTDILGKPDYEKTVRSMMEEQHKQMLRNLVNGVYDAVAQAPAYALDGPAPVNFTATSPATSAMAGGSAFKGLPSQSAGAVTGTVPLAGASGASGVGAIPLPGAPPGAPLQAAPLDFQRPAGGIHVTGTPPPTPAVEPLPPEVVAARAADAQRAVTGEERPKPNVATAAGTIFGENLISEKSLDEVILGYLAEDLVEE
jgi:hypothetical protein